MINISQIFYCTDVYTSYPTISWKLTLFLYKEPLKFIDITFGAVVSENRL